MDWIWCKTCCGWHWPADPDLDHAPNPIKDRCTDCGAGLALHIGGLACVSFQESRDDRRARAVLEQEARRDERLWGAE